MPILNKTLLLRVCIVTLILGVALFFVHRVQANRVPDALLWQANAAAEKGKTDKAIAYMRQYLEFKPDDHDTVVKLADMVLERAATFKDYTNAHFLYERVLRESPNRDDVARKLVTLCIKLGRTEDAAIHVEKLLRQTPQDGVLTAQLAEIRAGQNRHDDARKLFEGAIGYAPTYVTAYDKLGELLKGHFKKPQEAAVIYDRLVAANSTKPEAFLIRAKFLREDNKPDLAFKDLEQVLKLDAKNADGMLNMAELLQAKGELRQAKALLQQAIALNPRDVRGYRALSWLELLSGNQADAMACLEKGIAVRPESATLLTPLADLWIEQGEFVQADGIVKKLEARKDAGSQIKYLRGRILMKQGKWNDAVEVLESLRTEAMDLPGLATQLNLLIAGCQDRRGDREGQLEALKRILAAEPAHLGARVAFGNLHLSSGKLDDSIREYQLATRSPFAGMGVWITYANLRLARAKLNNGPAEEWQAIEKIAKQQREQHPLAIDPLALQSESMMARGAGKEAMEFLQAESKQHPDDLRCRILLASVVQREQGILAGVQTLAEGQITNGDAPELTLARARLWADDYRPGGRSRLGRFEMASVTAADADRLRLLRGLSDLYLQVHDEAGLKRVASEIASRDAKEIFSRKLMLQLALQESDRASVAYWSKDLNRIEGPKGSSAAVLDGLNRLANADSNNADLVELARKTLSETPDQADAHLLTAELAVRRGDQVLALKHFDMAAECEPTAFAYQRDRIVFHMKFSQPNVLRSHLARLLVDPRLQTQRTLGIIAQAIAKAGPDSLEKCLTALLTTIERDSRLAIWAGQLLETRGQSNEAMALYRALSSRQPAQLDAWACQLILAAKIGETELKAVIEAASKSLERDKLMVLYADCGSLIHAKIPSWSPSLETAADRRSYAQACLVTCEARGKLEDALPVLKSLAEDGSAPQEDIAWAKRTLAAVATAIGTEEKRREGIAQLREQSGKPVGSITEARNRYAALSVAFRGANGDDRRGVIRDMIALLGTIVSDPSATGEDWFQLAQLYRITGDRSNCRKCLEELVRREPKNLTFLAAYVDDLLSEQRMEEAQPHIAKLMESVQDFRVIGTAARYFALTNQPRTSLDLVDRYVRAVDLGTSDSLTRQRQVADLLEQLTRLAASKGIPGYKLLLEGACERFRASLKAFPEAINPMVSLMAFDGQVKAAFEELDRHKNRLSPAALAMAGVGILRSGHAEARQFQTVQAWIEVAQKAEPDSIQMKLNLAELQTLRQDFATAELAYRDVLRQEPKNIVALNNLAWILAPQPEAAEQAMKFADRAIELYGATGEMLDTRARILIAAGKYDRAIADLNDAINEGQTPLRYFHLAIAQLRQSHLEQASKSFREARARGLDVKAIHPSDLPIYKQLEAQVN